VSDPTPAIAIEMQHIKVDGCAGCPFIRDFAFCELFKPPATMADIGDVAEWSRDGGGAPKWCPLRTKILLVEFDVPWPTSRSIEDAMEGGEP